jgi:hypothetical protein
MGGGLLQAASHNISSSHPFFMMGGDALSYDNFMVNDSWLVYEVALSSYTKYHI